MLRPTKAKLASKDAGETGTRKNVSIEIGKQDGWRKGKTAWA
jgi:hypothetical protein